VGCHLDSKQLIINEKMSDMPLAAASFRKNSRLDRLAGFGITREV
jgi:hypothetical protein